MFFINKQPINLNRYKQLINKQNNLNKQPSLSKHIVRYLNSYPNSSNLTNNRFQFINPSFLVLILKYNP